MNLEELANFDTSKFDCSRSQQEFLQVEDSMRQWQDIVSHQKYIAHDLETLLEIKQLIHNKHGNLHSKILTKLNSLKLPHTKTQVGLS